MIISVSYLIGTNGVMIRLPQYQWNNPQQYINVDLINPIGTVCVYTTKQSTPIPCAYYTGHDDVIKWKHFPRYWPFVRGNSPVTGEFPAQRPVTQSFDVFFDLRLNKRLSKQSRGWWFETPSHPLCCRCSDTKLLQMITCYYTSCLTFCSGIQTVLTHWSLGDAAVILGT